MVCLLWRTTWHKSNFSLADKQLVYLLECSSHILHNVGWIIFFVIIYYVVFMLICVCDLCLFWTFLLDNLLKNMLKCSWDKKLLTEQAKFNLDVKNKVFIVFLWIKVKTRYNTSKRNLKYKDCITLSRQLICHNWTTKSNIYSCS